MQDVDESVEYSTLLRGLSDLQLRFLSARLNTNSDRAAARELGISESTAPHWDNFDDVRRAISLARLDGVELAREKGRRGLTVAVDALIDEAGTKRSRQRVQAAGELLDRFGLPKITSIQHSGPGGGPVIINLVTELGNRDHNTGDATSVAI